MTEEYYYLQLVSLSARKAGSKFIDEYVEERIPNNLGEFTLNHLGQLSIRDRFNVKLRVKMKEDNIYKLEDELYIRGWVKVKAVIDEDWNIVTSLEGDAITEIRGFSDKKYSEQEMNELKEDIKESFKNIKDGNYRIQRRTINAYPTFTNNGRIPV